MGNQTREVSESTNEEQTLDEQLEDLFQTKNICYEKADASMRFVCEASKAFPAAAPRATLRQQELANEKKHVWNRLQRNCCKACKTHRKTPTKRMCWQCFTMFAENNFVTKNKAKGLDVADIRDLVGFTTLSFPSRSILKL